MKILHITSHLNIGGIPRAVLTVSKDCVRRGHHVTIASGGGSLGREAVNAGIELHAVPLNTSAEFGLSVWKAGRMLSELLASKSFDILHAHTRVAQVTAQRLSKKHGIPWVATWHGFYRNNLGRKIWPCTGNKTIAISEPVRRHLIDDFGVAEDQLVMVPHGIEVDFYHARLESDRRKAILETLELPEDCRIIGTVSRLVAAKGIDYLIRAMDKLRDRIPNAALVIVGDGPHRSQLESLVRSEGLTKNVRFVGAMSEIAELLALMDVFVFLPTNQEGFGLTLLEAMASGCPVVAVNRGMGAGWLLNQTRLIQTVSPSDPVLLMEAIEDMLDDSAKAQAIAAEARQWVTKTSSSAVMTDKIEALYQSLIEDHAALSGSPA